MIRSRSTPRAPRLRQAVARRGAGVVAALGLALAAGCGQTDVPESLPGPTSTTVPPTEAPPETPGCEPDTVTHSLRPGGQPANTQVDPDSYMATIRDRGRLRVGVDTSTLLFSSVDPVTGDFEGFDVEIAREVATALFGGPDAIEFVAIPKSARVDALLGDDPLDMVADTFTINCARAAEIDFSSVYFTSHQRLLVRTDEPAASVEELVADAAAEGEEATVCAPAGSTSLRNLEALPDPPELVAAPSQGACLVKLQQGEVDGVSTDDTILAGMIAQDPNLQIVGEPFSDEPYGLGLPPGHDEWVRYVNTVLEDVRNSGRWAELYDQWFLSRMGAADPPDVVYQD